MFNESKNYVQLPGRRHWFLPQSDRLYLGDDHLLRVRNSLWDERCVRYYYRDIHCLTLCGTNFGQLVTAGLVFLLILILGAAVFFTGADYADGGITSASGWVLGLFFLPAFLLSAAALVIHVALGSMCECRIATAINHDRLPSLCRMPAARKALAAIWPHIDEAQGHIASPENWPPESAVAHTRITTDPAFQRQRQKAAPPRREPGYAHWAMVVLLYLDFVLCIFALVTVSDVQEGLNALLWTSLLAATVIALGVQRNSTVPRPLRTITWAVLAYLIPSFFLGVGYALYAMVQTDFTFEPVSMADNPFLLTVTGVSMIIDLVLATAGVVYLVRYRAYLASLKPAAPPRTDS